MNKAYYAFFSATLLFSTQLGSACTSLPVIKNKNNNCYFASWIQILNTIPELKERLKSYKEAFLNEQTFVQLPLAQQLKNSFFSSPDKTVDDLTSTINTFYKSPIKELIPGYINFFEKIAAKPLQITEVHTAFDQLFGLYTSAGGGLGANLAGGIGYPNNPPNLVGHPLLSDLFRMHIIFGHQAESGIADLFVILNAKSSLTETFTLSRNDYQQKYPLSPALTELVLPLPPLLFFVFSTSWEKEYTIPLSFDLALYLPEKTPHFDEHKNKLVYDLIGLTAGGTGHAVAYVKSGEEKDSWCLCDTLTPTPKAVSAADVTLWHDPETSRHPLYMVYKKRSSIIPQPSQQPSVSTAIAQLAEALKQLAP